METGSYSSATDNFKVENLALKSAQNSRKSHTEFSIFGAEF